MNTNNRLQFRHHDQVFDTRDAAIEYIQSRIRFTEEGLAAEDPSYGYSLLAEPTILLYKNADDETDPHLILVIGSQTNEGTQYSDNRFCIIDIDKTEKEIADLAEEVEKAISALTLVTLNSDSLNLYTEKTEEGTYVSGDVKVATSHIFDDERKGNNLMVSKDGLFIYVNLTYDEEDESFTFTVSNLDGTLSETTVNLPNNYVTSGYYSKRDESIHLIMRDGDEVLIDCEKLIAEWDVEGDSSKTPLVLTKEEVDYDGTEEHHHVEPWQDILRADVRLKDEQKVKQADGTYKYIKDENSTNILNRTNDGRYLYVDGKASNIIYYVNGEKSTVKAELDKLQNVKLSTDNDNILITRPDGFFASTKLEYISDKNKLVFKTSGHPDKEIQLNSVELFENVYYDSTREVLVLTYKDNTGQTQFVEINIGEMIRDWEWEPQNEGHNVKITKKRNIAGNDKVSADAKIYNDPDNILVDKNHELFVKGTADNIKYGNITVKKELDNLIEKDGQLDNKIDQEIARATSAETALNEKIDQEIADRIADVDEEETRATAAETLLTNIIGSGFTDDTHETVTYKFNDLQNKLNAEIDRSTEKDTELEGKINDEITRSTEKDTEHDTNIQIIESTIGSGFSTDSHETVTYKFNELQNVVDLEAQKLNDEITRSTEKDTEHDGKIQAIEDEIGDGFGQRNTVRDEIDGLNSKIEAVSADSASSIKDVINLDKSINVDKTDATKPVIKVNLSDETEIGRKNIIKLNSDGLFASVDLSYIPENNTLIFHTSGEGEDKRIQLESMSSIISITYDPTKEAIVITYLTNGHEVKTVEIPVGDLINEWRVEDGHPHAVKLEKVRIASGTSEQDVLKASVVITDDHDDNILVMDDGALYVSGQGIVDNTNAIASLDDRMGTAEGNINTLQNELAIESERRISGDTILSDRIIGEETRATNAESALSISISNEVTRATTRENEINTLLANEIDRAQEADNTLSERIINEQSTRASEDTRLENSINVETTRAQNAESSISDRLTSEVSRSTAEDTRLSQLISAETQARIDADTALSDTITANRLTFDDTTSIDFNNPYLDNNVVKAEVKIQGGDNIIKLGQGLYATATLEYEPTGNKIRLVTSNGAQEYIQLVGATILDSIEYDSVNKRLIIKYTDGTGSPRETSVGVTDLWNDLIVQNPSEKSAVEMTKTIGDPGNPDTLSARVLITDDTEGRGKPDEGSENVIEIRNNGLYVDGTLMREAKEIAECTNNELKSVETAIFGNTVSEECGSGFTYTPDSEACIISAATSLYEADQMLNNQLCEIITSWTGGKTYSTESAWVEEGNERKMEVDVRLSHGNLASMTDEEMLITDYNGRYVDPTSTEFSDTNVLRIVAIEEGGSVEPKQNGVYLSNNWDCGLYYSPSDTDAKTAAEAAGYNTNYSTDESPSASNINYMNNVRQNDPIG